MAVQSCGQHLRGEVVALKAMLRWASDDSPTARIRTMSIVTFLRVPCIFQGGKQRVAAQISDVLIRAFPRPNSRFYDLCCGSGAISIELVNRGIDPARICMLDISLVA